MRKNKIKKLGRKAKIKKPLNKKTKRKIAPKVIRKAKKIKKIKKLKVPAPVVVENIKRARGRPKGAKNKKTESATEKVSNVYFTTETEDAIVAYNKTTDSRERERLYNEQIQHAFFKIAENVYNTFKFSYADVSPLEIQKQCISHMVANIDKYDKPKGRAFSYFSIVAKNWFILDNNTTYKRFKKHVEICEHAGDAGEFVVEPEHQKRQSETKEFIKLMVDYWDRNVGKLFTKARDLKIANAVVEIFRNADRIDVFNKKALYLYIREIAECHTQNITKIINRMKPTQRHISEEYLNKGHIAGARA
jgi:hypothetical protein